MLSNYAAGPNGQTVDQTFAGNQLDQLLNLLNTQSDGRYIFSGAAVDQPSVATSTTILNGTATQAGLKQIISERNQADLGANGLGRLVIPAAGTAPARMIGSGATLAADAPATVVGLDGRLRAELGRRQSGDQRPDHRDRARHHRADDRQRRQPPVRHRPTSRPRSMPATSSS